MGTSTRSAIILFVLASFPAACRRRAETPAPPAATVIPVAPTAPTAVVAPAVPTAPMPAAPTMAAPAVVVTPSVLASAQTLAGLDVRSGAATVFRHTDGNWHVRVSYSVHNGGAQPIDLNRDGFKVAEMDLSGGLSNFPEHVTINPGLTITGDIAWYYGATNPQPRGFTVRFQPGDENAPVLGTQAYVPVLAPTEPAPGVAPTAAVFTLPVTAEGTGLTFVRDDGNRHFRVTVRVQNTTTAPLRVYREHFHARVGETEASMAGQPELTSWGDPVLIAPGASVTGSLGFYVTGDPAPNPAQLRVLFGPVASPQADFNAPVAAGASVL